ncbi:MAG: tRNA (guanosine(37)-N1)-methyltransferase TrmD [Epsilonproteobacteria bacterium]|nr:tRNA (guanosine(37)-N1)-methyltransferase TrmD [Campylobacterota bacterium]
MRFTFVTLFENLVKPYFEDSILKRAIERSLFEIDFKNPRDYAFDKHKKVDDYKIGGGAGLLLKPKPLSLCLDSIIEKSPNAHIIITTPVGKLFRQNDAKRLAKREHIVFVSGRYEGIDERIIEEYADEVFSIGDFVLTGGELASLVMCDAIARNIEGVLGNRESLSEESYEEYLLEAPSFTKPNIFKKNPSPSEFLKGNHGKITALKKTLALAKTKFHRSDLYLKSKILQRIKEDEK